MTQENILTLLKRDTVDNTFSLQAFQSSADYIPVTAVYHNRDTVYIRIAGQHIQEMPHFLLSIQQSVIHIHIKYQGTVIHLLAGNGQGLFVCAFLNQAQELPGAGNITSFTHVHKGRLSVLTDLRQLQAG